MRPPKRNKAVIAAMAISLAPLIAGCAHSRSHPEPLPAPPSVAPEPAAPAPLDPKLQMPLPYTFSRHGVEVQVNYVEFVSGQPQVNVSLHETRNQPADILASTLMQARTESGKALPCTGYLRDAHLYAAPEISLKPDEHLMLTLTFQPPDASTSSVHSAILEFPTGKWWSSPDKP